MDFNDHEISKIKFVIKDYTRFVSNFNWNTFMFDYYYDLYGTENGRERNELDMLNNFDLMVNQSSITVNNGNNRFQNCVKTDLNSDEDTYTVTLDLTEYVDDRSQYITEKVLLRQITFNQLFERWRGNFDVYEYTKTYATINAREFVLGAMNNSGGGSTGGTDSSVDLSNYFTKDELSELYYTKEEADERFQLKGETGGNTGTDTSVDLSDYFTKDEIEDLAYDMNILIQEKVDEVKDIVEVETKVNFFNDYDARGA